MMQYKGRIRVLGGILGLLRFARNDQVEKTRNKTKETRPKKIPELHDCPDASVGVCASLRHDCTLKKNRYL